MNQSSTLGLALPSIQVHIRRSTYTGPDSFRAVVQGTAHMAYQQPRVGGAHSGKITLAGASPEHSTHHLH